jgi:Holliday junction resolvase RusA-like endonuclease
MKIIIPGIPVPQARMKHSNRRGFVTTYDPKAKEKSNIRNMLQKDSPRDKFNYPRISFLFHMPIPASIPKREKEIYESGLLKHTKKPDADNFVKLYLDCLDGIVIEGDQKVSLGAAIKVYHPEPKTIIHIAETSQLVCPWELDYGFLSELKSDGPSFFEQDSPLDSCTLCKQVLAQCAQSCNPFCKDQSLSLSALAHRIGESKDKAFPLI